MKPFHTIAIPHKDILEGRLTMDVFAADLSQVVQNKGPEEYRDADTFFKKTFLTDGLTNLLSVVEKRLSGKGGDPVIQIQTPFGGGKTHSLIAMYHKAKEWNAKRVVLSGTDLSGTDILWEKLEEQLGVAHKTFTSKSSPGKEAIIRVLSPHQPLLILMDEILEYATKAAAVKVEQSNLGAQTIVFLKDLTEAIATIEKACLVLTLPSSILEHYDENAERLYQQLQKVSGRVEKIYTPVQDNEVAKVIRQRLFSYIDEKEAKKVVEHFVDYAEKESLILPPIQPSQYRDRFLDSYPFLPELIDVLYHRWGSFPNFQRTRGVLRLLSLVISSLKGSNKPYISIADVDLSNQEIRQEFIKFPGQEYNSVIDFDITYPESGSKKIDDSLGKAYQGLKLATRAATTIFLYSFSGGVEKGAKLTDIKRSATTTENPSSVVAEAVEQLKGELFYLQSSQDKYYFSNQPNLNRIRITKMDNIKDEEVIEMEEELLKKSLRGDKLKIYIWEENYSNISDSEEYKLVVLKKKNDDLMKSIIENKGQTPRVNRNTIFFHYPLENERTQLIYTLKLQRACEEIEKDKTIVLTEEQRKENSKELKNAQDRSYEALRRYYRFIGVPVRDSIKEVDLGIPTYGERKNLYEEIYNKLRSDNNLVENIAALVIKEKYLSDKDYVLTEQMYQSMFRTPGELRPASKQVIMNSIRDGVKQGLFGLGELEDNTVVCRFYKEDCSVALSGKEVIISEKLCKKGNEQIKPSYSQTSTDTIQSFISEGKEQDKNVISSESKFHERQELRLKFEVPKGKVSNVMGVLNYLQSKFNTMEIQIHSIDGSITEEEYESKIKEAFRQMGIDIEEF